MPVSASRRTSPIFSARSARAGSIRCSSRTVTADHASGAPAIAAAHPDATFSKFPWPEEDARYDVPWRALSDGEVVDAGGVPLTTLHTPGHSPDHVAFWHQPSATIFTGDLVVQGSSVMIHWSRGGDLGQYMASLERLLALSRAACCRRTVRRSRTRARC